MDEQRATLRAVVFEDNRNLLSTDVRARERLSSSSSLQSDLAALVHQGLLMREGDRHVVIDSLSREWVARKTF